MRKPDFFIVGAPKCGTTFLYASLREHPEIFMPDEKEPTFFGTDLTATYFVRDVNEYLALFAEAGEGQRVGEASVWYLYSRRAAQEIKAFCPSAQIIVMLRNPVEMMYSLHSQRLFNRFEDIEDFEQALAAEDDRKKGLRIPHRAQVVQGLFYRDVARYTDQVRRYFEAFGRHRTHVIIYDDLVRSPAVVYADTCEYLGVASRFQPVSRRVNTNKRVRSDTLRKVLKPPHVLVAAFRHLLSRKARTRVKEWLRRLNSVDVPRPPMESALRQRLQAEFAPEVERLSELLGRDLTHWTRQPQSWGACGRFQVNSALQEKSSRTDRDQV